MAFRSEDLIRYHVVEAEQALTPDDCILYALSVGVGNDPTDAKQLPFVYEIGITALPMMANVLAHPGFWVREPGAGIDWRRVVHGEQSLTIHRRLPVQATLIGRTRIRSIADKGSEKGAFVYSEREVFDKASGQLVCTLAQTNICRGDGGSGSVGTPPAVSMAVPARVPDFVCDLPIPGNAALLYRLNGDRNPLHADPEAARSAGFPRPILHGLCTFAIAGHAILRECCDYDDSKVKHMRVRFTAPAFPGETLRTEIWRDSGAFFRSRVVERSVVVLDGGRVEFNDVDRWSPDAPGEPAARSS